MRRGITLLEVLISLGILAVGLTSVLSLIPAGRSFAARSSALDQAATMSENAFSDAVTFGLTNINSLTSHSGGPPPPSPIMIDPAGLAGLASSGTWASWTTGTIQAAYLKGAGIYSGTSVTANTPRNGPEGSFFLESRDGIFYGLPATDDVPPSNQFSSGVRAYDGRNSWIAMLTKSSSGTFTPGDQATLTIITFSGREQGLMPPANSIPPLVYASSPTDSLTWTGSPILVPGRDNKDVLRAGAYFLIPTSPPSVRRIAIAELDASSNFASIQFEGDRIPAGLAGQRFFLIPDATSATEYTVTIEGKSDFTN